MTGYTVHTGSTEQFSEGWDRIFSGKKKAAAKRAAAKPVAKAKAKKKARKK